MRFSRFLMILIFMCSVLPAAVFAKGKSEEAVIKEPLNKEWVLCVTSFNVSAMPESRRLIGEILAVGLVDNLNSVDRRIRVSPEYAYYEGAAWSKARAEAGKKLAAKRDERDLLLYKGDPNWRYRKNLNTLNGEIAKLEIAWQETEADTPLIFNEPDFKLTSGNIRGTFPAPPAEGTEHRFLVDQQADAFLTGSVAEYHNRIYISIRLYTLYAHGYQYEDSTIFASDDINTAVDELAGRLVAAVSGAPPAAFAVIAEPKDAIVLANGAFLGRGETGVTEHPPGIMDIQVFADDHESASALLEIKEGELAKLYINLRPLGNTAFNVTVPEKPGSSVYQGSLYIGEAPLSLDVPLNGYEYISVETPGGEEASAVFRGASSLAGDEGLIEFRKTNLPSEEKQVDTFRRKFYGAYGRFWVILPAAFMISGIMNAQVSAYNRSRNPDMYDKTLNLYYISGGAWVVVGLSAAEIIYRSIRYLIASGADSTPIAKTR